MPTGLIVFAKAPVAGQAKTRLIPALGAAGAAALAERLLVHAVEAAVAADLGPVELCVTPDAGHEAFDRLADRHRLRLSGQGDGDLGQRMHRALSRTLAGHRRALLFGSDAPALDAAMLRDAARALDRHDAVFVPALDGGYVLVGLTTPAPALFSGMAWSHAQVMDETRVRARDAGLGWAELPAVPDIDVPADLAHLKDWPGIGPG
jgi:rSAM/selenodomain-associated transferase 1